MANSEKLIVDLRMLGVKEGDMIVLQASMDTRDAMLPGEIIEALQTILTSAGTLLVPSFSYLDVTGSYPVYHAKTTESNMGVLSGLFRTDYAQYRSLHPTHSVCGWGRLAYAVTAWHTLDDTPAGSHSPLSQLPSQEGKLLLLGTGLHPDAFFCAVEEAAHARYALSPTPILYTITDDNGRTFDKNYYPRAHIPPAYQFERLREVLSPEDIIEGTVLGIPSFLIDSRAMMQKCCARIHADEAFFLDKPSE